MKICSDDLINEIFNLVLSKRRTRQLSSDNSLKTSPEPKKLRECEHPDSPEGEREEESNDVILSALTMAKAFQK